MSDKSSTGQQRAACKRSFTSFTNENTDKDFEADNVFGFMDDSETVLPQQKAIDHFPVHDLTENPTYLMEFGFGNGFVWNEEVLLVMSCFIIVKSPPFSSSTASSYYSQSQQLSSSNTNKNVHFSSYQNNRVFPSLLAEKLRQKRISQETKVAEIRID